MPPLSRLYIRAAFVNLLAGFTIGALLLAHKGVFIHPALWGWLPAHIELLLIGWIVQFIMGTAFWIAPRFWKAPRRGNETSAQAALLLINAGVWLVVLWSLFGGRIWMLASGRLLEVGAAIAFSLHLWQRVVPRNYQPPSA
ncbi:MAG: hypothetical protein GWP61_02830 [Chloroflexi bacterium]|jgi:hypothetical protein|nr:hypothetical protein [Chloroflexota bacterium]